MSKFSLVLQIILAIVQRKSSYFWFFLVLVLGELLNLTFKHRVPYNNWFYVLSSLLALPLLLNQYWKKRIFWFLVTIGITVGLIIPLYNQMLSLYVLLFGSFLTSSYLLYKLIKTAITEYRLSYFLLILFLYMLGPAFKLFFILAGTKLSEVFFLVVLIIEIFLTIALIFLRDTNQKHSYRFSQDSTH